MSVVNKTLTRWPARRSSTAQRTFLGCLLVAQIMKEYYGLIGEGLGNVIRTIAPLSDGPPVTPLTMIKGRVPGWFHSIREADRMAARPRRRGVMPDRGRVGMITVREGGAAARRVFAR